MWIHGYETYMMYAIYSIRSALPFKGQHQFFLQSPRLAPIKNVYQFPVLVCLLQKGPIK